jgi:antitoxin component of RelBE/YafQ-DinJ toxin-antitoxin module
MGKKKLTINIDEELDKRLEKVAAKLGLSKSGFVRMVVIRAIEEEEAKGKDNEAC